ncbi:hypothetical protein A2U01_0073033, partial [Trifolium medium]|nr:hypothetical protein [Trifolium medium]
CSVEPHEACRASRGLSTLKATAAPTSGIESLVYNQRETQVKL